MRKLRRFIGWSILLVLIPFLLGVYGALPYVLTEFVKWKLIQQGFKKPDITVGYPSLHALTIDHISLEKETPSGVIELTIRNGVVTYQPSQLSVGHISHIYIPDATIRVIPPVTSSGQDEAMAVTTQSALTLNAFLQPVPPLPFEQFTIDSLVIVHHESKSPLHKLVVAGTLQNNNGNVHGKFSAKGPYTPEYEITVKGESLGNMDIALFVPGVTPTHVWDSHVQANIQDDTVQVAGSITTDIPELNTFLSFIMPVPNVAKGASGRFVVKWEGVGPKDASLDALHRDANTEISGTFHLKGKVPTLMQRVQDLAVDLNGTFTARSEAMMWSLSPQSSIAGLIDVKKLELPAKLQSMMQAEELPLVFSLPKGLQGVLRNKKTGLYVEVHETGCIQANPTQSAFSIQLCLTDWQGRAESPVQGEGAYALTVNVPKARIEQVSFDRSTWELHGKIGLLGPNLEVSLAPSSAIELTAPSMATVSIPSMTLNIQEEVVIHYGQQSNHLTISPGVLKLELPSVEWNGTKVALQGATLSVKNVYRDSSNWLAQGTVNIRGVSTTIGTQTPPVTHWNADVILDPSEVFANILVHTDLNTIVTKARLTHSWKTNRGVLQAKVLPISFSPTGFLLSQSLQPWTYPFDIASGKLSALAHIFWKKSSNPQDSSFILETSEVELGVRHLTGHYKKVMFQDLTTNMTMRGAQQWVTPKPMLLTLQQLHSGIDITNISGHIYAVVNPFSKAYRIQVNDLSSGLFGGMVQSQEMVFESTQAQQRLKLNVIGVQLEELLQLEQQQGLEGTGLIDGVIPLTMGKTGIEVHQGKVEARAPGGVIQYHSAEETLSSLSHLGPQMQLVVDALENFKYDVLRAGVDYAPDGTLNLRIRLEGKNPDLQLGRPIHVNFNFEENIPSLLKSLAVVRGIEKDIERMLNHPLGNSPGN